MQAAQFQALVDSQYVNATISLRQVGGSYAVPGSGNNIVLNGSSYKWLLESGNHTSVNHGAQTQYHGYWIYRTDVTNMAWQAVDSGGGGLDFWNWDRRAAGNPEDYEIFNFRSFNPAGNLVKIQAAHGFYLGLNGVTVTCDANENNATVFEVEF